MSNKIRIIATSDVHGKVFPHEYSYEKAYALEYEYGFAKLAMLVKKLKNDKDISDCILIDNGDTLEGSPLQSFYYRNLGKSENDVGPNDAYRYQASPASYAMSLMGYDYINIGNHDFDFGRQELAKHIEASGAKCINLNIGYNYAIKKIAGYKFAFFGVLTHLTTKWESEEKLGDAVFPDAFMLTKETVKRIQEKEKPDYIVCCYHGGLEMDPGTGASLGRDDGENQGYKMLSKIDGLDVIIMGHQHTLNFGIHKGKAYSQPGVDGTHVSVIDIDPKRGDIEVKLVSLKDEKMLMDGDIVMDLAHVERACQEWLDEPIGTSKIDLKIYNEDKERLEKSQFTTFINKVQMERLNADISSSSLFEGATGFGKQITMRNIVSSYAFPNTLVKKKITGKVLREYIEKTLEFWDVEAGGIIISQDYLQPIPQYFNYDIFDGIEYEAEVSRPRGARLTKLTRNGVEIKDDDEFSIVINNYRAAGGGNYPMLADLEVLDEDLTSMIDVLSEYIEKHGEIDFEPVYNVNIRL